MSPALLLAALGCAPPPTAEAPLPPRDHAGDLELPSDEADQLCGEFEALTVVGDIYVGPDAEDLSPLACVERAQGRLWIDANQRLVDLAGLDALAVVAGDLRLTDLPALESLDGLGALRRVGGKLELRSTRAVASLDALASLEHVGALTLNDAGQTQDLAGLDQLTAIEGDLRLRSLPALIHPGGLEGLTRVGGGLHVTANERLLDLQGLEALAAIDGALFISSNQRLKRLRGLGGLLTVGGEALVASNVALLDVSGLEALEAVGSLRILRNRKMASLRGLEPLRVIDADESEGLQVWKNALRDITPLFGLEYVGGDVSFYRNDRLPAGQIEGLIEAIGEENIEGDITAR